MNSAEALARGRRSVRRTLLALFGGSLLFLAGAVFFAVTRMPHMLGVSITEARAVRVEQAGCPAAVIADRAARERLTAAVQAADYRFGLGKSLRRLFGGIEPAGAARTVTVETVNYQSSVVVGADGRELAARWFVFETDSDHAAAWLRALAEEASRAPAPAP